MNSSTEIAELAKALCKAQSEMKAAKKSEANPYFHSKYADLANIMENDRKALMGNGLSVVQGAGGAETRVCVTTRLLHTSGQWIEDTLWATPKDCLPQSVGATVTYLRRYGYSAMVGSTAEGEDDDGEEASGRGAPVPASVKYAKVKEEGTVPNAKNAENPIDEKLDGFRKRFADLKNSGYFTQAEMKNMNAEISKVKNEVPSLGFLLGKWEMDLADRKNKDKDKLDAIFNETDGKVDTAKEPIF